MGKEVEKMRVTEGRERGREGGSGEERKRGDNGRIDDPKWTSGLECERASPSAGKGPADGRTT